MIYKYFPGRPLSKVADLVVAVLALCVLYLGLLFLLPWRSYQATGRREYKQALFLGGARCLLAVATGVVVTLFPYLLSVGI